MERELSILYGNIKSDVCLCIKRVHHTYIYEAGIELHTPAILKYFDEKRNLVDLDWRVRLLKTLLNSTYC